MAHPIQHVVVLMLENRSFDHLLGALDQRIAGLEGVQAALRYLADPAHANAARPGSPAVPFTGDASPSLDRKSLALVAAKAAELGAQVWMARIEGGDGAIMIENGERARPATLA